MSTEICKIVKQKTLKPDLTFELEKGYPDRLIAGVDEVGRGCLAGPVVAAAVILPQVTNHESQNTPEWLSNVKDSKKLSPRQREWLAPLISKWVCSSAIGLASVEEIDKINIYHASLLAMSRAVYALDLLPHFLLVDGNALPPKLPCSAQAFVKGDQKCLSIACASIIAKVWRDHKMQVLDQEFPGYGLAIHKGYATQYHLQSLRKLGPSQIHRTSFHPVL